jgi:type II secretory pathway pseudopilin PulG
MIGGRPGWVVRQRGYAMVALLVAMAVMAVTLSVALPVFKTVARREREAELVFRGEQYARAIGMFQRKYGNALPPNVEVLLNERFLRKAYTDPITGEAFKILGPGSPELAEALTAAPAAEGRGTAVHSSAGESLARLARETGGSVAVGGILAVTSSSPDESLRLYNGKGHYNEWFFMALQASVTAGAPEGSQAPVPGLRGRGAGPSGPGQGQAGAFGRRGRGRP